MAVNPSEKWLGQYVKQLEALETEMKQAKYLSFYYGSGHVSDLQQLAGAAYGTYPKLNSLAQQPCYPAPPEDDPGDCACNGCAPGKGGSVGGGYSGFASNLPKMKKKPIAAGWLETGEEGSDWI